MDSLACWQPPAAAAAATQLPRPFLSERSDGVAGRFSALKVHVSGTLSLTCHWYNDCLHELLSFIIRKHNLPFWVTKVLPQDGKGHLAKLLFDPFQLEAENVDWLLSQALSVERVLALEIGEGNICGLPFASDVEWQELVENGAYQGLPAPRYISVEIRRRRIAKNRCSEREKERAIVCE